MALDQNFKHLDIREALENTHMRGRNITFLDDFSRNEIHSLFQAAKMLEPFMRTGTDLLKGKVLYRFFSSLLPVLAVHMKTQCIGLAAL